VQRARPAQRTVPAARRGLTAQDPPPAARMHPARIPYGARSVHARQSTQTSGGCPVPESRTM